MYFAENEITTGEATTTSGGERGGGGGKASESKMNKDFKYFYF